jgi:hypothetical protein
VRIIKGSWEGIYGWLAANYLSGTLLGTSHVGFLDMGGASTQIAFATQASVPGTVTINVGAGNSVNLYARTFLGYGANQARKRYVDARIHAWQRAELAFREQERQRELANSAASKPAGPGLQSTNTDFEGAKDSPTRESTLAPSNLSGAGSPKGGLGDSLATSLQQGPGVEPGDDEDIPVNPEPGTAAVRVTTPPPESRDDPLPANDPANGQNPSATESQPVPEGTSASIRKKTAATLSDGMVDAGISLFGSSQSEFSAGAQDFSAGHASSPSRLDNPVVEIFEDIGGDDGVGPSARTNLNPRSAHLSRLPSSTGVLDLPKRATVAAPALDSRQRQAKIRAGISKQVVDMDGSVSLLRGPSSEESRSQSALAHSLSTGAGQDILLDKESGTSISRIVRKGVDEDDAPVPSGIVSERKIEDPCLPLGLVKQEKLDLQEAPSMDAKDLATSYTFHGTGSLSTCRSDILSLFFQNVSLPLPLPVGGRRAPENPSMRYIAVAEYWYSTHDLLSSGGPYSAKKHGSMSRWFCGASWNALRAGKPPANAPALKSLSETAKDDWIARWEAADDARREMQCFKGAWVATVLEDALGLVPSARTGDGRFKFDEDDGNGVADGPGANSTPPSSNSQGSTDLGLDPEEEEAKAEVRSVLSMGGFELGWTLGAALADALARCPVTLPGDPLSNQAGLGDDALAESEGLFPDGEFLSSWKIMTWTWWLWWGVPVVIALGLCLRGIGFLYGRLLLGNARRPAAISSRSRRRPMDSMA